MNNGESNEEGKNIKNHIAYLGRRNTNNAYNRNCTNV